MLDGRKPFKPSGVGTWRTQAAKDAGKTSRGPQRTLRSQSGPLHPGEPEKPQSFEDHEPMTLAQVAAVESCGGKANGATTVNGHSAVGKAQPMCN